MAGELIHDAVIVTAEGEAGKATIVSTWAREEKERNYRHVGAGEYFINMQGEEISKQHKAYERTRGR